MPRLSTDEKYKLREQYESSNGYFPDLLPQNFSFYDLPQDFPCVPYNNRRNNNKIITMYQYDCQINVCWNRPDKMLSRVSSAFAVCTPDYSVYIDRHRGEHFMNLYRSRWVGRYLQENGIRVIPSITFTDVISYEYCFLGIPKDQIVIVDAPSWDSSSIDIANYILGLQIAIERLQPHALLVYGRLKYIIDELPNELIIKELLRFCDTQFNTRLTNKGG